MPKYLIKPTKERIMIISQNRGKVKKKALSLINQLKPDLSRPLIKFILEICFGRDDLLEYMWLEEAA
jgi:hypothetical protein